MSPDTAVKIPSISWACIKLNRVTFLEKFFANFSLKWSYYLDLCCPLKVLLSPAFRQGFARWVFSLYEFVRMLIYLLLWLIYFLILFLFPLLMSESLHASALKTHLFLIHGCYESMPLKPGFPLQLLCIG